MLYKNCNNMSISRLGMGALRLPTENGDPKAPVDRKAAKAVIQAAINAGINVFDTGYTYLNGDSERFLGEALSEYSRESYYLSTKFYVKVATDIEAVFEEQLRRLQTDYIDFYLLHGLDEANFDAYLDKDRDYIGYLLKQKEAGRIRHIGFSSHATPKTLERFLEVYDGYDMAIIQLNYIDWSLLDAKRQYEILTEHNIPVWVMEPQKGGRLSTLTPKTAAILREENPELSLSSWGFRWLQGLDNVQVVLSGMSTVEQVVENAALFSVHNPLSEKEIPILEKAKTEFLDSLGVPCSSCRYCCDTCPAELDIPLLIQGYNEKNISGETWRLSLLNTTKSASECLQCGICTNYCPQKINIPEIMKKISDS